MRDRTAPPSEDHATGQRPRVGQRFDPHRDSCGFYPPDIVGRQPHKSGLTDAHKRLYERSVRWAGRNGRFWRGFETIATALGKSERQVKRDMAALERLGLIEHDRRGKRQSNMYYFLHHQMFESEGTQASHHSESEVTDSSGEVTSVSPGEVTSVSLESYKKNYVRESSSSEDFASLESAPETEEPCDDDRLLCLGKKPQDPDAIMEQFLSGKEPLSEDPLLGKGRLPRAFLEDAARALHASKCSTDFGGVDLERYSPPDRVITTRIAEHWRGKGIPAFVDWICTTVERGLGRKGRSGGAMVYGLYFADSRACANVWEEGRFQSKKFAEQITIREVQARLDAQEARRNQLLNAPVALAEAIRILDSSGREWRAAVSERFLWFIRRQADTISPAALLEAAVAWRPCRTCRESGLVGSPLKGTLSFCECEIGRQEQLDRGDGYIVGETERVNSTPKSRLVQALRELKLDFTGDAVEQADTAVAECDSIIEVRPGAGAEAWCCEPDLKQALKLMGDARAVCVSAAKSSSNAAVASFPRITQDDIDRAVAEHRSQQALRRREPASEKSSDCQSNSAAEACKG